MSEINLPEGWSVCTLADIGNIQTGNTPPKNQPDLYGDSFPIFKPGDLDAGSRVLHASEYLSEAGRAASRFIPAGSTYVTCIGATIGKTGFVVVDGTCNQQINAITPEFGFNQKWMFYWICSPKMQDAIISNSSSTTLPILNKSKFSSLETIIPPLAEQQQIAQKLDELLAQVDTLKTRLDAIPKILKRFRQSVLAAAVSGRLTEEWRGKLNLNKFNSEVEELAKFRDQELEALPEGWQWLKFEYVADIASNLQSPLEDPKAIHIAPNHIESGSGKLLEFKTVEEDNVTSAKHRFYSGQILYSKIRPYLCKVAIANFTGLCSADMYPVNSKVETKYLFRWMLSSKFTEWASNAESRSVLPKINQNDLNKIPVPTPPPEEQTEIVRRVEQLFAYADQIEQRVKDARARVNHLTQSILAKAFRGELTADWRAQNPELLSGENSAAALLERVRAEREVAVKKGRKKAAVAAKR